MLFSWKQEGGAFRWRWHISQKSVLMPEFTVSERGWVLPAEERFWQQGVQKEEKNCVYKVTVMCWITVMCQVTAMWPFSLLISIQENWMRFSESLKKNHQFRSVYQSGRSYANKYLVMYIKENGTERNRIGISVSKKVGNSVVRHRISRLLKESYRLHENIFNSGLDIVIIARPGAAAVGYKEAESALLHLSKLHCIVKLWKKFVLPL